MRASLCCPHQEAKAGRKVLHCMGTCNLTAIFLSNTSVSALFSPLSAVTTGLLVLRMLISPLPLEA